MREIGFRDARTRGHDDAAARTPAHEFYRRLGYPASHEGFKLELLS